MAGHRCGAVHRGLDGYNIISDYAIVESIVERPDGYRRMHKKRWRASSTGECSKGQINLRQEGGFANLRVSEEKHCDLRCNGLIFHSV